MNKNPKTRLEIEKGVIWTEYTGTREALIAEGVATSDMFPIGRKTINSHLGNDVTEGWRVTRLREERFRVTIMHERAARPDAPAPWDPLTFKQKLLRHAAGALDYMILQPAAGDTEKEKYGTATHRLNVKDRQKLLALREQLIHAINQATVERVDGRPRLRLLE
jgi:hypothetical protein